MNKDVKAYNNSQSAGDKAICNALADEIDSNLTNAENKIWHAHPVWFLDGNPIVGYSKLKESTKAAIESYAKKSASLKNLL